MEVKEEARGTSRKAAGCQRAQRRRKYFLGGKNDAKKIESCVEGWLRARVKCYLNAWLGTPTTALS